MQKDMIESETEAYLSLKKVDFGKALPHKNFILAQAEQYSNMWEERVTGLHKMASTWVTPPTC